MTRHESDTARKAALGRAIRVLRAERGLSRAELARLAEISYTHLAEIENGKKELSGSRLSSVAEALGVLRHELMAIAEAYEQGHEALSPEAATDRLRRQYTSDAIEAVPPAKYFRASSNPAAWEAPATPQPLVAQLLEMAERLAPDDLKRLLDLAGRLTR